MKYLFLVLLFSVTLMAASNPKISKNKITNSNLVNQVVKPRTGQTEDPSYRSKGEGIYKKENRSKRKPRSNKPNPKERSRGSNRDKYKSSRPRDFHNMRPRIDRVMRWLSKNKPEEYEKITKIAQENPKALAPEIRKVMQKYGDQIKVSENKNDPKRQNDKKISEYIRKYHATNDLAEKNEIKAELRVIVEKDFNRRQKEMKAEHAKMVAYLKTVKNKINKMEKQRDSIVDGKINRMLDK